MVFDVLLVAGTLVVYRLGWVLRIYVDVVRLAVVTLIAAVLFFLFPHFDLFVQNSSVNTHPLYFYGGAAIIILTIFVTVNHRLNRKNGTGDFVKRLTGSLVFTVLVLLSFFVLIALSIKEGWIVPGNSFFLGVLSERAGEIPIFPNE